ncbi:MAG: type II toxin-antitoxin system RelE/ParE family toxin [Flavisolibacter sp.]|nr:type II toxin-antitoxin system RelE/ParE family toxin [Flavisolibacter sp.]MBD0377849.1 type II toxin-antitoxin system RelE/ParE family toxin [Flavisolibacter sp.]
MERKIIFHGDYFTRFYLEQTTSVQEKIEYVLRIIRQVERVPKTFLQHLEDTEGLYEIRVEYGSNLFRIFCCFDEGNLVVLLNGFQKKSQKTPVNELQLAKRLMKEYFDLKKKQDEKQKRSNKKR